MKTSSTDFFTTIIHKFWTYDAETYTLHVLFAKCWMVPAAVRDIDTFSTLPYWAKYSLRWRSCKRNNSNIQILSEERESAKKEQNKSWGNTYVLICQIEGQANNVDKVPLDHSHAAKLLPSLSSFIFPLLWPNLFLHAHLSHQPVMLTKVAKRRSYFSCVWFLIQFHFTMNLLQKLTFHSLLPYLQSFPCYKEHGMLDNDLLSHPFQPCP